MCASAHGSKTFNGVLPHRLCFKNLNSEDNILFIRKRHVWIDGQYLWLWRGCVGP
jgi:hypothetical protein